MKKSHITLLILILIGVILINTSCNKDEEVINDETTVSSADAIAESLFDDVTIIADQAYSYISSEKKNTSTTISDCAIITIDLTSTPKTMTIDFGNTNCLCNDGRYRQGIINVSFTGNYREQGTIITYSFDNYFVNNNEIDGTKIVTNMGNNNENNTYYTVDVQGFIHLSNNAGTITWNSSTIREWIEGFETTLNLSDDIFLITGSANGIRPSGQTWEREIIDPLRIEIGCRWIVSGTMEITPENESTVVVDWGIDGECDNIATVIVNDITYTIFLP